MYTYILYMLSFIQNVNWQMECLNKNKEKVNLNVEWYIKGSAHIFDNCCEGIKVHFHVYCLQEYIPT